MAGVFPHLPYSLKNFFNLAFMPSNWRVDVQIGWSHESGYGKTSNMIYIRKVEKRENWQPAEKAPHFILTN